MEGYTSLKDYLFRSGILNSGDQDAIARAKQEYRKEYMRNYKRDRRATLHEVVISIRSKQYKTLQKYASKHGYSVPKFLLYVTDQYIKEYPVVQHPETFNQLLLFIGQLQSDIKFLADRHLDQSPESFLKRLEVIEDELIRISTPVDLVSIVKQALDESEGDFLFRQLSELLSNYKKE